MMTKIVQDFSLPNLVKEGFSQIDSQIANFRSKAVSHKSQITNSINRAIDCCNARKVAIKDRVCKTVESIKTSLKNAKNVSVRAVQRASVCGAVSGVTGGVLTAVVVGSVLAHPIIGAPVAIAAGMASSGVFATAGASVGAAWPLIKGVVKRVRQMDVKALKAENSQLKFQLEEQKKFLEKVINNDLKEFSGT